MKITGQKKRRLLRFLFGSFSATALMFTFQACYGPPQRPEPDEFEDGEITLYEEQDTLNADDAVQADSVYTMVRDGKE